MIIKYHCITYLEGYRGKVWKWFKGKELGNIAIINTKLIFAAIIIKAATGFTTTAILVSVLGDKDGVPDKNASTSVSKCCDKHPD